VVEGLSRAGVGSLAARRILTARSRNEFRERTRGHGHTIPLVGFGGDRGEFALARHRLFSRPVVESARVDAALHAKLMARDSESDREIGTPWGRESWRGGWDRRGAGGSRGFQPVAAG